MTGAIPCLRLVRARFLGEERLDLDLRGWVEGTRKTLVFHLGLRKSTARKSKGSMLSSEDSEKPSLTLQTGLNAFMLWSDCVRIVGLPICKQIMT